MSDHPSTAGPARARQQSQDRTRSRLKIAVLGYYGFGNLGDEIILKNIKAFTAPHEVFPIQTGFRATREAIARLNSYDLIVLGGGGLFQVSPPSPFDNFDEWMNYLDVPIYGLGLGVESLAPEYKRAAHCLVKRSRFFQVRDEESKKILDHSEVVIAPDLTFYNPLPRADSIAERMNCGINIRPTHQGVEAWVNTVDTIPFKKIALPFSTRVTFDDRQPLRSVAPDCPLTLDLSTYLSLDLVVGMALHSIVFAVQSSIPVVAIDYSPKVCRFMHEVGLQEYTLAYDQDNLLSATVAKALNNRNLIRQASALYTDRANDKLTNFIETVMREINSTSRKVFGQLDATQRDCQVSVIIQCAGCSETDLKRTVDSIVQQTYRDIEVIIVHTSEQSFAPILSSHFPDRVKSICINSTNASRQLHEALKAGQGQYVSIVPSGATLFPDAISVLKGAIESHPEYAGAYADCYLERDGIIEQYRKANGTFVNRNRSLSMILDELPCLLVSRESAIRMLDLDSDDSSDTCSGTPERVLFPISLALIQIPSTAYESNFIQSAIAFSQMDFGKARKALQITFTEADNLTMKQIERFLQIFQWIGYDKFFSSDPCKYWETVLDHFPVDTKQLTELRIIFAARFSLEEAYIYRERKNRRRALKMLGRAIRYDNKIMTPRGSLIFLKTLLWE